MNTQDSKPARAAAAPTAPARLPVEEQDRVRKPKVRAASTAMATTRSLKEWEGLPESSLTCSDRRPSSAASRSARTSGARPGFRVGSSSTFAGTGSSGMWSGVVAHRQRPGRDLLAVDRRVDGGDLWRAGADRSGGLRAEVVALAALPAGQRGGGAEGPGGGGCGFGGGNRHGEASPLIF